jgi:hypothetical protein
MVRVYSSGVIKVTAAEPLVIKNENAGGNFLSMVVYRAEQSIDGEHFTDAFNSFTVKGRKRGDADVPNISHLRELPYIITNHFDNNADVVSAADDEGGPIQLSRNSAAVILVNSSGTHNVPSTLVFPFVEAYDEIEITVRLPEGYTAARMTFAVDLCID